MTTAWIGMVLLALVLCGGAAAVGYQRGMAAALVKRKAVLERAQQRGGLIEDNARETALSIVSQLRNQAQAEADRIVGAARGIAEVDDDELIERLKTCFENAAEEMQTEHEYAVMALEAVRG